jgi:hypothetical protein
MIFGVGAAQASTLETFDTPVVLSPTEAPGAWYTDRFAPAGFAASGGVLHESISGADHQGIQFYNTQGRKLDLAPDVTSMSIDLFVNADYNGSNQRLAGFWGSAVDSTDAISAFPIVELTDVGGALTFQGWDTDLGVFNTLGAASAGWHTLGISLGVSGFSYSIDGTTFGTAPREGSTSISNVILQGYNTGASYDIAWDNLATTSGGAVPEPANWALMIVGFGGVGAMMRRRTVRSATA